ncbi:hypothetical protein U1Q18_015400 [Sarracenia purpurea var. burkii]
MPNGLQGDLAKNFLLCFAMFFFYALLHKANDKDALKVLIHGIAFKIWVAADKESVVALANEIWYYGNEALVLQSNGVGNEME